MPIECYLSAYAFEEALISTIWELGMEPNSPEAKEIKEKYTALYKRALAEFERAFGETSLATGSAPSTR